MNKILITFLLGSALTAGAADSTTSSSSTTSTEESSSTMSGSTTSDSESESEDSSMSGTSSSESAASGSATGAGAGTAAGSAPSAGAATTPAATCQALVTSAKNKNFDAFMKMTTDMPAQQAKNKKATKGNFQKMQSQYFEQLQDLECGKETVANDRAVVESTSKGEKRLVPFVKTGEGWKFDMKTYQAFYDIEHGPGGAKKK